MSIKLKDLLKSRQQQEENTSTSTKKKVVVVMNIVDHVSLVNASIFSKIWAAVCPEDTVVLIDIRDLIPEDGDKYFWVEVGDYRSFLDYYADCGRGYSLLSSENKVWLDNLRNISVFVNGDRRPASTVCEERTQFTLLQHIPPSEHSAELSTVLMSNGFVGSSWLLSDIPDVTTAQYWSVLQMLFGSYHGAPITLENIARVSNYDGNEHYEQWHEMLLKANGVTPPNPGSKGAMLKSYVELQKNQSAIISLRQKTINLNGKYFLYMNDMSRIVYASIRRAALAGKNYIHVSEGMYGRVIFTNSPDQTIQDYIQKGSIVLRR